MIEIHERPDVVAARRIYLEQFFTIEIFGRCWITFFKNEFLQLMDDNMIDHGKVEVLLESAYEKDGLVEFHIDDNELFLKLVQDLPLPGQQSIRAPDHSKTLLVLGQDESVFVPHSLKNTYWMFDGITPYRTKTEGAGVMISTFALQKFGMAKCTDGHKVYLY